MSQNSADLSASGRLPLWSSDGGELFFSSLDNQQMLAVSVQSGSALVAGRSEVLFEKGTLQLPQGCLPVTCPLMDVLP